MLRAEAEVLMIDSHCHLADDAFADDLDGVIGRARDCGPASRRSASCRPATRRNRGRRRGSGRCGRASDSRSASIRIRQEISPDASTKRARASIRRGISGEGAVAIGEIGLDYHYDFSPRRGATGGVSRAAGDWRWSSRCQSSSTRAKRRTTRLASFATPVPRCDGVFHCFTGDVAMARAALDIGFYVSLAGIVTFPRAESLREVATLRARRSAAHRNGRAVSGARAASRQAERAGVCRACGRDGRRASGRPGAQTSSAQMARNFEALLMPALVQLFPIKRLSALTLRAKLHYSETTGTGKHGTPFERYRAEIRRLHRSGADLRPDPRGSRSRRAGVRSSYPVTSGADPGDGPLHPEERWQARPARQSC